MPSPGSCPLRQRSPWSRHWLCDRSPRAGRFVSTVPLQIRGTQLTLVVLPSSFASALTLSSALSSVAPVFASFSASSPFWSAFTSSSPLSPFASAFGSSCTASFISVSPFSCFSAKLSSSVFCSFVGRFDFALSGLVASLAFRLVPAVVFSVAGELSLP